MEPLGQTAYQTWRQEMATRGATEGHRSAFVEWENLPVEERESWEAMAQAIVNGTP